MAGGFPVRGYSRLPPVIGDEPIRVLHFFPIPFLVCLAILTLVIWKTRQRSPFYRFVLICFSLYLLLLIGFLFFPIMVPDNWPHNLSRIEMKSALDQVNLIPLRHTGILDSAPLSESGLTDVFINFLMTLPIGMALPYLASSRVWFNILSAMIAGLLFEGVQLTVKLVTGTFYHTVDINDVIMNALGVLFGYFIFKIIHWFVLKLRS